MDSTKEAICQSEILNISNLSVTRSGTRVIHDINLSILCGEFVGIVGPNGGGKSTLLLTLLGILKPKTGQIQIYGKDPFSKRVTGRMGWVPQSASQLPSNIQITVKELIQLGTLKSESFFQITKNNRNKVKKVLQMVGLEDVANKRISSLSGGQRQRAAIGKALASDADLILMDEPLVGVDRDSRNSLLKLLDRLCHEENKTILMVSHDLTTIKQTVHRMIYLEETISFDGSTSDFPDLSSLALLRGIEATHDEHYQESLEVSKNNSEPIVIVPKKSGD